MKKEQLSEDLRRMQELAGIITEAKSNDYYKKGMMSEEETNNFTLKFVKDFETPSDPKREGWGKIIMRDVLNVVKAAGEQGLTINDLFTKHDKFKDVTAMKPVMLNWINQLVQDGYLSKALSETNQGMRDTWDFDKFKQDVDIMAPGSGITQKGNKIVVVLKKSQWHSPKAFQTLINNYSKFIDKGQPFKGQFGEKGIVYTLKGGVA